MFKLIKNFEKRDYILIILTILLIVVQVWLDLKMPDYMSEITMLVKTEGSKMSDILYNGGFMLLCSLGSLVSTIISGYFLALLASGFSSKLREKIFYKVQIFCSFLDMQFHSPILNHFVWHNDREITPSGG